MKNRDARAIARLHAIVKGRGDRLRAAPAAAHELSRYGIAIKDLEVVPVPRLAESVIVCVAWSNPLILPDNRTALCDHCGEAVQHRPYYPATAIFICTACAVVLAEAEGSNA